MERPAIIAHLRVPIALCLAILIVTPVMNSCVSIGYCYMTNTGQTTIHYDSGDMTDNQNYLKIQPQKISFDSDFPRYSNSIPLRPTQYNTEGFFNDSFVHEIRITFNDTGWYDRLYQSHDKSIADPYFPADFEGDGVTLKNIGIKMKGYTSFKYYPGQKKSFRLDFNEFQEDLVIQNETSFMGLKQLNLNNNYLDPTFMREKLTYDLAGNYVPTPRSVYTRLYINGEYWGLYSAVESIDMTFQKSRFGPDEQGTLWRTVKDCDLSYLGENIESYNGSYTLKNNVETNNWSSLIRLCRVLNNTSASSLPQQLEPIFDVDGWLWALAVNNLLINLDSYMGTVHNYYLYERNDTGRLTHEIWDCNMAFGILTKGMTPDEVASLSELNPFWLPKPSYGESLPKRPLMEKLWEVPEYRQKYLQDISQLLRGGFDSVSMNKRITQLAEIIRFHIQNDTKKQFTNQDFETGLTSDVVSGRTIVPGLGNLITIRADYMDIFLDSLANRTDVRLNELMSDNHGSQDSERDEKGDADPWLELYNPGPGLVNISGLYLSDDVAAPGKWPLPGIEMNDGNYTLIWVDGESSDGKMHAGFKLNTQGGTIYLFYRNDSDYLLVDSINYPAIENGASYGRIPDGDGQWQLFLDYPTPGKSNIQDDLRLYINEFMASNRKTIADPDSSQNSFPDWIELYNGGSSALDISGMFLTDNSSDTQKWPIPPNTKIEPGKHLLVWADNNTAQGPMHANFRLPKEGGWISLYASDGLTSVDTISFGEQFTDVSYGRLKDGIGPPYHMFVPTPGLKNIDNPEDHEIPYAYAGGDMTIEVGKTAIFNGSASTDNIGIVAFSWTIMYNGSRSVLNYSVSTFVFSSPGIYSVILTVVDSGGNKASDTLIVKVIGEGQGGGKNLPSSSTTIIYTAIAVILTILVFTSGIKITERRRFAKKGVFR